MTLVRTNFGSALKTRVDTHASASWGGRRLNGPPRWIFEVRGLSIPPGIIRHSPPLLVGALKRVGVVRKAFVPDVITPLFRRISDDFLDVRVGLRETRHVASRHPNHVVDDEHLAVAIWPRPDANGGNLQPRGQILGDL